MKLTLTSTRERSQTRGWMMTKFTGTTEQKIPVVAWVAIVHPTDPADQAKFEDELRTTWQRDEHFCAIPSPHPQHLLERVPHFLVDTVEQTIKQIRGEPLEYERGTAETTNQPVAEEEGDEDDGD